MQTMNDQRPKVSVILPVYNNEKYLRNTLDSVKNQTFTDFEILCIDDGSTDNSPLIIKEYAAEDNRFRYIHQDNSGAGPARNNGLSKATGEYIAFLDGDDLYYPDFLKRMIDSLEKTRADVCICEREDFNSKTNQILNQNIKYQNFEENRAYRTQDLASGYFGLMGVICWNKVFRHTFLLEHSYEFQSLRHCNDVAFVCSSMAAAETVCFIKERLVRYRKGTGDSTQDKAVKYPLCALEAFGKARENVYQSHKGEEIWQRSIDIRCADAFFNTFEKDVLEEKACREAYDAFKNKYEDEWQFRDKAIRYFGGRRLRLRMWSYRRTTYEGMRKAYTRLYRDRAKKTSVISRVKGYSALFFAGLFRR